MNLWSDRRLRLTLTRLGLHYLAAMIFVGAAAVHSGNNLLYAIFSLMLGLFLVSGWLSRSAILGVEAERLTSGRLFARLQGTVRIQLRDGALHRLRALEIQLCFKDGRSQSGFYPGLSGPSDPPPLLLTLRPSRRGWCPIEALELRTRFPFGFLEKTRRFPLDQRLLILPHPRLAPLASHAQHEAPRTAPRPGASHPEGARPFRPGDALSRVHWKRTAQRKTPWVRTFEEDEHAGLHLELDLRTWAPGPAFELELERLSGAILHARLQKQEVVLQLQGTSRRQTLQGATAAWKALALAEAEGSSSLSAPLHSHYPEP